MEVDAMQASTSKPDKGKGKGKAKATKAMDTNKPKCPLCGFAHTWNNCYYNNKNKDKRPKNWKPKQKIQDKLKETRQTRDKGRMCRLRVVEVDDEDDDNLFEDLNTIEVPEEDNFPCSSRSYTTQINDKKDLVQRLERLKVRDSPEARSPTLSEEEEEQYLYLLRKKYPGKDFH